ncbi:MAG: glycosyltransferase family 87 protein [Anaerolineaceae bacterium]|nr:glycosyltransferase family 87 protein [Anaerolineaceae bacterium]
MLKDIEAQSRRQPGLSASIEDILYARKGFQAYLPFLVVASILMIAAVWQAEFPTSDVVHYQCYSVAFWTGDRNSALLQSAPCSFLKTFIQYHTFPPEYPPFSLLFFSIPLLIPELSFPIGFALLIAGVFFAVYRLLLRFGPPGSHSVFALHLLSAAGVFAFMRYDLLPAGLTLAAVILAERKRWGWAYVALAVGVLTKAYPLAIWPVLFLAEQRDAGGLAFPPKSRSWKAGLNGLRRLLSSMNGCRWSNTLIFLGVFLEGTAAIGLFNFQGALLGWLANMVARPFQVESIGSSLLWLASFANVPVVWKMSFESLNILSPLAGAVSELMLVCLAVGGVTVLLLQIWKKIDLVQAAAGILLLLLATGKVFSPQYLIWLAPLLAYAGSSRRIWLLSWGSIAIFTTLIYAFYGLSLNVELLPSIPGFMQLVLVRNSLLVFLVVAYLFNLLNLRHRERIPLAK